MDDKTESVLIASNIASLPSNLQSYRNSDILFSLQAKNVGVALTNNLSMEKRVNNICKSAYIEIRRISNSLHYLSIDATKISSVRLFCQAIK